MKHAYDPQWLHNLDVVKESKSWWKAGMLSRGQLDAIHENHKTGFFHPNVMIRILLFIATLMALSGVTGMLGLMFSVVLDDAYQYLSMAYGVGLFLALDFFFVRKSNHYKSGVNEAFLYQAIGFTIVGVAGLTDFENVHVILTGCVLVFSFAAYRYLDLISTAAALCSFGGFLFYELYQLGGTMQQVIPIVFIVLFTPLYFYFKSVKQRPGAEAWENCLVLCEAFALLVIYAAGNYFVVRELSIELLGLDLGSGEDIPLAFVFYGLTGLIPAAYLYLAIASRDVVLLRVSLVALAFSVFTFKYYFSLGHPEFTLTASGVFLLGITLWLQRYLKTQRQGWTRENILTEKWADMNAEAFVISQTVGGNAVVEEEGFKGGGGDFSGGGSSGNY